MVNEIGSIMSVYKPKGMTSFEVVRAVRHELKLKKVGHAGTLDPLAEGLLILLTGSKTKLMDDFLKFDKEYLATLKLGVISKSHDLETEVVEQKAEVNFSEEKIAEVLRKFTGKIEQVPPDYSAAWVGGKRAYHLARRGIEFELKPKVVTISEMQIESFLPPLLKLRIVCSSGTYVRSLARDIGEELGCGAVLTELVRTRIGSYKAEEAVKLDELKLRYAA
ncbi:MAG: tRNA pseudouridine(55) synthase TruB [Bacteroidetes bacterium]|nr:tRNA pseudouridine(55) synthase TruB [Bacteroidota bacterium]MCL5738807.1 tRNA pseudouridine(55) synthase TruB [Bacteroidota bacterium]